MWNQVTLHDPFGIPPGGGCSLPDKKLGSLLELRPVALRLRLWLFFYGEASFFPADEKDWGSGALFSCRELDLDLKWPLIGLVCVILNILCSRTYSPLKTHCVVNDFKRTEFEHQGNPHAHILLWLKNALDETISFDKPETIRLATHFVSLDTAESLDASSPHRLKDNVKLHCPQSVKLFYSNKEAEAYNTLYVMKDTEYIYEANADDTIVGYLSEADCESAKRRLHSLTTACSEKFSESDQLRKECLANGVFFEDPEFPCKGSSVWGNKDPKFPVAFSGRQKCVIIQSCLWMEHQDLMLPKEVLGTAK
ncbi:hypothetical protein MRX96_045207 [Rhipicephalus microplus]